MRKIEFKKILSIIFFLNTCFAFCQMREATIIFNDSTSILGYGEIKKNVILFKVDEKDEVTEWNYESVAALIFSGYGYSERFEYVKVKENSPPKILELLEKGKVNLYREIKLTPNFMVNPFSAQANGQSSLPVRNKFDETIQSDYYVKRASESHATFISGNFNKTAPEYFSDCKNVLEKIKSKKLSKKDIPEVIYYYNDYCEKDDDDN